MWIKYCCCCSLPYPAEAARADIPGKYCVGLAKEECNQCDKYGYMASLWLQIPAQIFLTGQWELVARCIWPILIVGIASIEELEAGVGTESLCSFKESCAANSSSPVRWLDLPSGVTLAKVIPGMRSWNNQKVLKESKFCPGTELGRLLTSKSGVTVQAHH